MSLSASFAKYSSGIRDSLKACARNYCLFRKQNKKVDDDPEEEIPKIEFQYSETFLRECDQVSDVLENNNDDAAAVEKCQLDDGLKPNYVFLNSPFYANINYNQVQECNQRNDYDSNYFSRNLTFLC